jgi:hypothetical protein
MLGTRLCIALSALVFVMGCDPKGTCVRPAEKNDTDGVGPSCVVASSKSSCDEYKGEFTKEDEATGRLRCESQGFTFGKDPSGQPGYTAFKKKK